MEKAYLRELPSSSQCELVFQLKFAHNSKVLIDQEIRSVRKIKDTVQSLTEHTKNKVRKILDDEKSRLEVTASFVNKNGDDVPGETRCQDFIDGYHNSFFKFCDTAYELHMNAPLVQSVVLPVMMYVNCVLQPVRFRTIYADTLLTEYFWYKSLDKEEWTEVGTAFKYKPALEDMDHYLKFKCIPKNKKMEGPPFVIESKLRIEEIPAIPKCPFQERHKYTEKKLSGNEFRIASYNTLSNLYSDSNAQFPYCSPQALSIDYRKLLIFKELVGYNADIICLQELDQYMYHSYFKSHLGGVYKSVFHKKGNRIPEGLACFYSSTRFKMLESKQIVLGTEVQSNLILRPKWKLIMQSASITECFIKQPTSLQVTVLRSKERHEIIIIANTHLYYHSEANDVRLLQVSISLDLLKYISNRYRRQNKSHRVSVIFCGDFNSVPSSHVYEFITKKIIQHTFDADKEASIRNICLKHSFLFESAYGTPEFTNYTGDFKGCLDYIFYDTTNFSLIDTVPLPDESILAKKTALPNEVFPSDHLALIASLKLKL